MHVELQVINDINVLGYYVANVEVFLLSLFISPGQGRLYGPQHGWKAPHQGIFVIVTTFYVNWCLSSDNDLSSFNFF